MTTKAKQNPVPFEELLEEMDELFDETFDDTAHTDEHTDEPSGEGSTDTPKRGKKNPHDGHRERLKARFLRDGFDSFEHHQMLELLLFYSIKRGDTNPIAHNLIERFGSLSGVFDASYEDLCRVKGVGPQSASLIKVAAALVRPYMDDANSDGEILESTEQICRFLIPKYIGRNVEVSYILCLDSKKKLLYSDILTEGTINTVPIFVRQIAEIALRVGATYVVLSHNHPNTYALPSPQDVQTTRKLKAALEALSVILLDHIVVSRNDAVSMADSGYFAKF